MSVTFLPSTASNGTPVLERPNAPQSCFTSAHSFMCGMAIPSPSPVEPLRSRSRIPLAISSSLFASMRPPATATLRSSRIASSFVEALSSVTIASRSRKPRSLEAMERNPSQRLTCDS